jgi:selenocysteine-specific elongation factor
LDKNPQSAARGITLDLGFSSFTADIPASASDEVKKAYSGVQFTLVDCPGHASLIKTVLGGASIIDLMILVVDANKGIQTQTAECLVVGEITTDRLIVALNKIDSLGEGAVRDEKVEKIKGKLINVFSKTKFKGCAMLPVSARPGGADSQALDSGGDPPIGMDDLKGILLELIPEVSRKRTQGGSFLFAVDHCFPVKGQGTVLTGTTLRGGIKVGDTIEIPHLKLEKKIKSMQMFKKPIDSCVRGDRLGICVAGLDAKVLERGLVCEPGTVPTLHAAVVNVNKIRFFKNQIKGGSKFHVTIGHTTVMATAQFFGDVPKDGENVLVDGFANMSLDENFDATKEYKYCEELLSQAEAKAAAENATDDDAMDAPAFARYALLEFDQPITVPTDELYIASRFDADIHQNTCRLAFHGKMLQPINTEQNPDAIRALKVFKMKSREGSIERVQDERTVIGKGMFKKESDLTSFIGMKVWTSSNECGTIEGGFGKSGKYKVYFSNGVKGEGNGKLILRFKKYVFEHQSGRKMEQAGL